MAQPVKDKFERAHDTQRLRYFKEIDEIFKSATEEAAKLSATVADKTGKGAFKFENFPALNKKVKALMTAVENGLEGVIVNGVRSEWTLANNKNNELCRQVFGAENIGRLSGAQVKRYFSNHKEAQKAFLARKERGLGLSERVWRYTDQFKSEIEMGLDLGISTGTPANQMARQLQEYLRNPDKLFRRVRNKRGQLHLSKNAKAFHPGQGVYRSSYKNARRLTATETNMAYRTADFERWKDFDFVVGIQISCSKTNHPMEDICDELAGRYPKDFKFTGWHPHCRCHVTTILKTRKEMAEDTRRILAGEEPLPAGKSANAVPSVPNDFASWVKKNKDRMEVAKTKPYFLSDNATIVDNILAPPMPATLAELDMAINNFEYTSDVLKMCESEVNTLMKDLFDRSDIGMEINSKYLDSVLEKGFLNTFETGTSGGALGSTITEGSIEAKHVRLVASHRMFNPSRKSKLKWYKNGSCSFTGKQFARSEYERYGHIMAKDKYRDITENHAGYGDAHVRFKRDTVRCTWTLDDSLIASWGEEYYQPTLIDKPGIQSFDNREQEIANLMNSNKKFGDVVDFQNRVGNSYIELQFHGELNIGQVESITFKYNPERFVSNETLQKLLSAGIELWYLKGGEVVRYGL